MDNGLSPTAARSSAGTASLKPKEIPKQRMSVEKAFQKPCAAMKNSLHANHGES